MCNSHTLFNHLINTALLVSHGKSTDEAACDAGSVTGLVLWSRLVALLKNSTYTTFPTALCTTDVPVIGSGCRVQFHIRVQKLRTHS